MLNHANELQEIARAIIRILSQPAEWIVLAGMMPAISSTHKAMLALVGTALGASAFTAMTLVTLQGVLSAPEDISRLYANQEVLADDLQALDRRIMARVLETEARVDRWDNRFEQLRCEIMQVLTEQVPRDCDQRLLRP
jgi:hypothetical protein